MSAIPKPIGALRAEESARGSAERPVRPLLSGGNSLDLAGLVQ